MINMLSQFGFAQLPQHMGNWFFKEQLGHLEIAVTEASIRAAAYAKKPLSEIDSETYSKSGQAIIEHMLTEPDKWWSYKELADDFDCTSSKIRGRLKVPNAKGMLERKIQNGVAWVRVISDL